MLDLQFVYLNISEVEIGGKKHLTELGWVIEDPLNGDIEGLHYFIEHPTASDTDRLLVSALGPTSSLPTRYSTKTVLNTLLNDLPESSILVVKTIKHKKILRRHIDESELSIATAVHLMSDVLTPGDKLDILSLMEDTRARAMESTRRAE